MTDIHNTIARYEAGAGLLRAGLAGLAPADLDAFPVPGTWSIRQIAVHIMESDLIATDRMKRIAAEEHPPLIVGYDESAFIRRLHPATVDLDAACTLVELNRRVTAAMLRALEPAAFDRFGIHNQRGKVTLGALVAGYADHLDHHMNHLRRKRAMLGKPVA